MEAIIRNVRDIEKDERHVLEHVLGQVLNDNQQVIFQVVTPGKEPKEEHPIATSKLPDWCDVFSGLSDEQIAEVEGVILQRADLTRASE